MKILELTNFSAGICGVWQRVKQEAVLLSKRGYDVYIFSSNATKGSEETACPEDSIGKVKIKRFQYKKLGGESFMNWDFEKEALKFQSDIIIAHSYRHFHTTKALKIAEELRKRGKKCKVFLVTHAPFIEKNATRSLISTLAVKFYDLFSRLNKFDKVIAITKWEIPYLLNLGLKEDKIAYIPNGIPDEFFKEKRKKFSGKKIMFLGRISPIKDIETLIKAFKIVNEKYSKIKLEVIGPVEKNYGIEKEISKDINFTKPIYNLREKIKKIQEADIFVLPSKTEAMPQSLIEAMSLGKIVISSSTRGGKEIIEDGKNGFLFNIRDEKQLAEIIEKIMKMKEKQLREISKEAVKTASKFKWSRLIEDIEKLF